MRHYIVPSMLRSCFPKEYKSHLSHDIVIICPACHLPLQACTARRLTKMERAALSLVPKPNRAQFAIDRRRQNIHLSATALLKHAAVMPANVSEKHRDLLRRHFDKATITQAHLDTAAAIDFRVPNPLYTSPAQLIVDGLEGDEELTTFIRDWRRFFVAEATPKCMPDGWAVTSTVTNKGMKDLRGGGTGTWNIGEKMIKRITDDQGRDLARTPGTHASGP